MIDHLQPLAYHPDEKPTWRKTPRWNQKVKRSGKDLTFESVLFFGEVQLIVVEIGDLMIEKNAWLLINLC